MAMDKLTDYSGEFIQNLQPSDFSPDTLAELVKLCWKFSYVENEHLKSGVVA